jgi:FkbM family methyltransferase
MFPSNDPNWSEVAEFILVKKLKDDIIIAPHEFQQAIDRCVDCFKFDLDIDFQWFVLHKGWIEEFDRVQLKTVIDRMRPVYANPVFVVFCSHEKIIAIDWENIHVISLMEKIKLSESTEIKGNTLSKETGEILQTLISVNDFIKNNKILVNIREIVNKERILLESTCRNACQTAYLGDKVILCRILTNYFCYVDATDISLTPHLLLNGYWEIWITKLLAEIIQPGWNCIDIGANCGYYTLLMADLVGESGLVLAVEPNPKLSSLVSKSLRLNGFNSHATVSDRAVANKSGETVQLCVPDGYLGDASIAYLESTEPTPTMQFFSVTTATIDELVAEWTHVDFIKIDAEGSEWSIWQGMQQTLKNNHKLTIVLEFSNFRISSYDPKKFLTEIVESGFVINIITGDSQLKPITFDECLENQDGFIDLVLIR